MDCDNFISAMIGAVVGGSLSLVGTWLANYLQQAAMRRHLQRERIKERIDQVRQYLGSSLRLSELVARLSTYEETDERFRQRFRDELFYPELQRWMSLAVTPATWRLYVSDEQALTWLDELRQYAGRFAEIGILAIEAPEKIDSDEVRDQEHKMTELAATISQRLDELVDEL